MEKDMCFEMLKIICADRHVDEEILFAFISVLQPLLKGSYPLDGFSDEQIAARYNWVRHAINGEPTSDLLRAWCEGNLDLGGTM